MHGSRFMYVRNVTQQIVSSGQVSRMQDLCTRPIISFTIYAAGRVSYSHMHTLYSTPSLTCTLYTAGRFSRTHSMKFCMQSWFSRTRFVQRDEIYNVHSVHGCMGQVLITYALEIAAYTRCADSYILSALAVFATEIESHTCCDRAQIMKHMLAQ